MRSRLSRQSEFLHLHLLFLGLFKKAVILSNVSLLPGENWCWKPQVFCPPCLISWRRTDIPKHILLILRRHTCRAFVIYIKRFIFGKKQMDTRQTEEKKNWEKTLHTNLSWGHCKAFILKMLKNQLLASWDPRRIHCSKGTNYSALPRKTPTFTQQRIARAEHNSSQGYQQPTGCVSSRTDTESCRNYRCSDKIGFKKTFSILILSFRHWKAVENAWLANFWAKVEIQLICWILKQCFYYLHCASTLREFLKQFRGIFGKLI